MAMASSKSLNVVTEHRPEDLLLEDAHLVVALEDRRLHVVAAGAALRRQLARSPPVSTFAPSCGRCRCTEDLLELLVRRLRADIVSVSRGLPGTMLGHALDRALHELS
jgi:hypothetical protein